MENGKGDPFNNINNVDQVDQSLLPKGNNDSDLLDILKKNKPEIDNEDQDKVEKEKGSEKELAEKWVEKYLPYEVLDAFALSYEKSKKAPELKRKNQKYRKYLKKAEEDYKPYLIAELSSLIASGDLEGDSFDEDIEEKILKILKSERRATRLVKIIMEWQRGGRSGFRKKNEGINKEKKGEIKTPKELEVPEEKVEFFEKYHKETVYTNFIDGTEFNILKYNPATKKVFISVYRASFYDEENEAHEFIDNEKRNENREMSYEEFEEFFGNSFSDNEVLEKNLKEKEAELLKRFSDKEVGFLQEALVVYVKDYREELEEYLANKNYSEEQRATERENYMENFWSNELSGKIKELEKIIPSNKIIDSIEYLKLKTA